MQSNNSRLDRLVTGVLFAFCAGVVLWIASVGSTAYLSNDGSQYLSTANQLLGGNGLKTTALYYEIQTESGMPAIQTVWPPGLPALIAIVSFLTNLRPVESLTLVSAIAHVSCAIVVFQMLRRWVGAAAAAVCAVALVVHASLLLLTLTGIAEPVFTLCAVVAAAALLKATEKDEYHRGWLVGASIAVGAACLTRYMGVALIGALAIVSIAIGWLRGLTPRTAQYIALLMLPASCTFGALIVRNLMLTGRATGGPSASAALPISEIAEQTKWALLGIAGIGSSPFAAVLLILAAASASFWLFGASVDFVKRQSKLSDQRRLVAVYAGSAVVGLVGIVYLMAIRSTGVGIEHRYFLPCVHLTVIFFGAMWPSVRQAGSLSRWSRAVFVATLSVIVIASTFGMRRYLAEGSEVAKIEKILGEKIGEVSLKSLLLEQASTRSPIFSNQSQALYAVLDRPTLGVPERRLTPRAWTPDEIVELAAKFGSRYLIVFRELPLGSKAGNDDFVFSIIGREPTTISQIYSSVQVILYEINPSRVRLLGATQHHG